MGLLDFFENQIIIPKDIIKVMTKSMIDIKYLIFLIHKEQRKNIWLKQR